MDHGQFIPGGSLPEGKPLRLLQAVPNRVYGRLIVRYPFRSDRDYAFFYHESAKRLASTYAGQPIDDTILMPFLLLYRQAFELQLKNFIRYLAGLRHRYHDSNNPELLPEVVNQTLHKRMGHNLAKLLHELLKHYNALDLPEEFPNSVHKLVQMMHDADKSGTAFRYAGELPESQDNADFPDLAAMLDEQFRLLVAVEDWVDGMYSAMPDPEDLY